MTRVEMINALRVKLNIDSIPDELYDALLEEFRNQFGDSVRFDDWEISAEVDSVSETGVSK